MYQLTVRSPDGSEQIYVLGDDSGLIVGRDESSDIVLPSSRVSRRHARFYVTRGALHLEDLGSQGGVFVGGARVNGTAELRPGPQIEIGEFKIRVKREEASVAPEYLGTLLGVGTMKGRVLTLPAVKGIIGREAPADLIVADDSVSRKHAEIRRLPDGTYVVRDLQSSNGTLVNNVKLAPDSDRPLRPLDKVAFGNTQWEVASTQTGVNPDLQRSRTRALLFLTIVSLLVVGAVGFIYLNITEPGRGDGGQAAPNLPALTENCEAAFAKKNFGKAVTECQKAYEENPIDVDLRKKLRLAQWEAKSCGILEAAKTRANVDEAQALEMLYAIESKSACFPSALIEVQKIAERQKKKDLMACREAARKKDNKTVLETCARYLDITCHNGTDEEVLKFLRTAESGQKQWSCPEGLRRWFGSRVVRDDRAEFDKMYPDKDLADAVRAYAANKIDEAKRALAKSKAPKDMVNSLSEDMSAVVNVFKESQTLLNPTGVRTADAKFSPMLPRDSRIMPPGFESYYVKTMRDGLAVWYFKAAEPSLNKESWLSAYVLCAAGAKHRPGDSNIISCLDKTEPKLIGTLETNGRCEDAQRIVKEGRQEGALFEAATKFIADNSCP